MDAADMMAIAMRNTRLYVVAGLVWIGAMRRRRRGLGQGSWSTTINGAGEVTVEVAETQALLHDHEARQEHVRARPKAVRPAYRSTCMGTQSARVNSGTHIQ